MKTSFSYSYVSYQSPSFYVINSETPMVVSLVGLITRFYEPFIVLVGLISSLIIRRSCNLVQNVMCFLVIAIHIRGSNVLIHLLGYVCVLLGMLYLMNTFVSLPYSTLMLLHGCELNLAFSMMFY